MRLAPMSVVAALALLAASLSADAQTTERSRTKIVVKKRSYLDAGTTVKPGTANYHLYMLPPNYHHPNYGPFADEGYIGGARWPLPRQYEIPGF